MPVSPRTQEAYLACVRQWAEYFNTAPDLITPDSPTQRVGEEPVTDLEQVAHRLPMLSIDNTYSIDELRKYGTRVAKLLPVVHLCLRNHRECPSPCQPERRARAVISGLPR